MPSPPFWRRGFVGWPHHYQLQPCGFPTPERGCPAAAHNLLVTISISPAASLIGYCFVLTRGPTPPHPQHPWVLHARLPREVPVRTSGWKHFTICLGFLFILLCFFSPPP